MAQISLKALESFIKNPDDWPRWKRRFKQFRIMSGLQAHNPVHQVSMHGQEAEAVLSSTNAMEDECKVYATIIEKFNAFFKAAKMSSSNERDSIEEINWRVSRQNNSWSSTGLQKIAIMER